MIALHRGAGLGLLVVGLLATPALADRIDGAWCDSGTARTLSIDGPAITTPGGHAIQGNYARHAFSYTVPAGEPGAGGQVAMRLLNETNVEIAFPGAARGEIWHRCQLNS